MYQLGPEVNHNLNCNAPLRLQGSAALSSYRSEPRTDTAFYMVMDSRSGGVQWVVEDWEEFQTIFLHHKITCRGFNLPCHAESLFRKEKGVFPTLCWAVECFAEMA